PRRHARPPPPLRTPRHAAGRDGRLRTGRGVFPLTMNLIVLCSDTYRVDHLSCYGPSPVQTPHLDRLAAEGGRFPAAFGEGTPTLPARRVLYTGRQIFPFLWAPQKWDQVQLPGWHPLFYEDVTLAEWLHERGYVTGLISDLPHQFKPGKNYHRG